MEVIFENGFPHSIFVHICKEKEKFLGWYIYTNYFKTIGSISNKQELLKLSYLGKQEIERLSQQPKLFVSEIDTLVDNVFSALNNESIRTVSPEINFGKIYDSIGFNIVKEELFRHLVIARLAFPLSKLKTIEYLYRFQGVMLDYK